MTRRHCWNCRNQNFYTQIFGIDYFNSQVWSVFDANLQVHTGASPDTSRYINILAPWQTVRSYPVDVCDDFNGGQYALFTTDGNSTGKDLVLCGTMPDTYTVFLHLDFKAVVFSIA